MNVDTFLLDNIASTSCDDAGGETKAETVSCALSCGKDKSWEELVTMRGEVDLPKCPAGDLLELADWSTALTATACLIGCIDLATPPWKDESIPSLFSLLVERPVVLARWDLAADELWMEEDIIEARGGDC